MSDYSEIKQPEDCAKETVCIDAFRVYDSCGERYYAS